MLQFHLLFGRGDAVVGGCDESCGSTLEFDECGVCNGSGAIENFDCDGNCLVYIDCSGVCGGSNTACEHSQAIVKYLELIDEALSK